jgi:hypothetical protein
LAAAIATSAPASVALRTAGEEHDSGEKPVAGEGMGAIGVSLPANLLAFADEEAQRRGTTRSGLLASLLEAERVQAQVRLYIDKHGWDLAGDEGHWRQYQQARMDEEYREDNW